MTKDEAFAILECKCWTPGCWHYSEQGSIYCNHCRHGACEVILAEHRDKFREAERMLEEAL